MHLLLTHEHTDFDALASLLAAALLYPDAAAILPHKLNHNVRDFLTLYWDELPFLERKERPFGRIQRITLVDTQYVPHIRGRTKQTQYVIIDHHAPHKDLPPNSQLTLLDTGATVTYLVEQLAAQNQRISPLHATLMLLGIHEDTGSLTYGGTTLRDMQAATWLVEQGAKFDVLRNFLNYALTPAQTKLYNELLSNLEAHTIHGHDILLGAIELDDAVEDMSSVAHRLRELHRPDGLLILVAYKNHVQFIARATTDAVNVGTLAEALGGGGHRRAAAAHSTKHNLAEMKRRLLKVLPKHVEPATTVRQIMSYGVRTVSPEQSLESAAQLMTRYGHEGYPVVDGGRIVGVLTRREVDKALHHNLGQFKVGDYMHSGEIFVTPDDTIETLQNIMFHERLGQVPVVEDGDIIGVVTRTDLITLWREENHTKQDSPQLNLGQALQKSLSADRFGLLVEVGQVALEVGCDLFVVGGFVRDLLLGRPGQDVDLVVEGDAIALANAMQARHGGRVRSHARFRTATWILPEAHQVRQTTDRLDFVTARTEFYQHPTALPEVERSSIKQDLHRRDFTINTLAVRLSPQGFGQVLDFYGGYRDLQNKHLRALHSLSFVEDPTRILRIIRLEQRLDFEIGPRTMNHLKHAIELIPRLSHERIFSELSYTFKETAPEKTMVRLSNLGVLQAIHPDLQADTWYTERCRTLRAGRANTAWADLSPSERHYFGLLTYRLSLASLNAFIAAYQFPADLETLLRQVQHLKTLGPQLNQGLRPSVVYNQLNTLVEDALLVGWLAFPSQWAQAQVHIEAYYGHYRHIQPEITGRDLIERFGLKPSPLFGDILSSLRRQRLDGQISSLAEEEAVVRRMVGESEIE